MSLLSRADLAALTTRRTEDVNVPEWNGSVRIRELSAHERSVYQAALIRIDGDGQRTIVLEDSDVLLAALSIIDPETDALMFGREGVAELGQMPARGLDRIVTVAQRLSGLAGNAVQAAAENLGSAPTVASPTS